MDKIDVGNQVSRWAIVLKKKKKKHLLLKHESIVRFVNAELVQWLRHLQRTNDQRMPTDVLRAHVYKLSLIHIFFSIYQRSVLFLFLFSVSL